MKKYLLVALCLSSFVPFVAAAQTSGTSCVLISSSLGYGARGALVSTLQTYLTTHGYLSTGATGFYGNLTMSGVERFQAAHGIQITGYVGPLTRSAMYNATCSTTGSSGSGSSAGSLGSAPTAIGDCTGGALYSASTGQPCSGSVLPAQGQQHGCTSSGYDIVTGLPCNISSSSSPNFTATPTSGIAPLAVTFTSSGADATGSINFGDGATGTQTNCHVGATIGAATVCTTSHTYAGSGRYTATVSGSSDSVVITVGNVSTAVAQTLVATTPTSGAAPLTVTFSTSLVSGVMNFGDGTASAATVCMIDTNPLDFTYGVLTGCTIAHTYTTPGTYTVTRSGSAATATITVGAAGSGVAGGHTPTLASVSPTSGPTGGYAQFTLTGTGFTSSNSVLLTGIGLGAAANSKASTAPATITLASAVISSDGTSLAFIPYTVAAGSYQVSVQNGNGTSNTIPLTLTASLASHTISPFTDCSVARPSGNGPVIKAAAGPTGGTLSVKRGDTIAITGAGFESTGNVVNFGLCGGALSPVYTSKSVDGGNSFLFTIPLTNYNSSNPLAPGSYALSVSVPGGVSNTISFYVQDATASQTTDSGAARTPALAIFDNISTSGFYNFPYGNNEAAPASVRAVFSGLYPTVSDSYPIDFGDGSSRSVINVGGGCTGATGYPSYSAEGYPTCTQNLVTHTYTIPGTYNVRLLSSDGSAALVTKSVTVLKTSVFTGSGGSGGSTAPTASFTFNNLSNATNVDPLASRTWGWSTTNASSASAIATVTGCDDSTQNGTTNPWTPWVGTGATGTMLSGTNVGVAGSTRYGCTITATYTATSASGASAVSTATVQFKHGSVLGASTYNFTGYIALGSTGDEVTQLQKKLTSLGFYSGDITGYFGSLTVAAVSAFQTAHSIEATGTVGPLTRVALNQ